MKNGFAQFAAKASKALGSSTAFVLTVLAIAGWLLGSALWWGFGDISMLWVNTISTLTTSIYVVLVQNTQARDTAAIMLKLDALVAADHAANNAVINAETLSDEDLAAMIAELQALAGGRPAAPE